MLKIKENSVIYIAIPPNARTGGPEALHQLCDAFKNTNANVKVIYISFKKRLFKTKHIIHQKSTPKEYDIYDFETADKIQFSPNNIIIIPEVMTHVIPMLKPLQISIWWLSVDNYIKQKKKFTDFNDQTITHLFQSIYAQHFLIQKKAKYMYPVFDYISKKPASLTEKKNIISYNPKKGFEFTEPIIKKLEKKHKFIPIINMNKDEVTDLLAKSKIYIDLGNHPGKDRLPREAALNKNIIITSLRGAAFFENDTPIPKSYKFYEWDTENICSKINDCIENYDNYINDFLPYINIINNQKNEFIEQVKSLVKQTTITN